MTELLASTAPIISSGVMAVGTAASAMICIAVVSFSIWALVSRFLPD